MRALSEYKAEILRRSEEKIRKRRQRALVLSVTIPIAACFVLLCLPLAIAMMPASMSAETKNSSGMVREDCMEAPQLSANRAEINYDGNQWIIDDSSSVSEISQLLTGAMKRSEDCGQLEDNFTADNITEAEDTLTLYLSGGRMMYYRLETGTVTDETGGSAVLTAEERNRLEILMGIP